MPKLQKKYIKNTNSIKQILGDAINELRQGKNSMSRTEVERLRAIGYLCSIALQSLKDGKLEERIDQIEKLLAAREQERYENE